HNRPKIDRARMSQHPVEETFSQVSLIAERGPERGFSATNQIEADVAVRRSWFGPGACQFFGFPRHIDLVGVRAPRDPFDGLAITVAGGEVLKWISACRIVSEDLLDNASSLEERIPIDGREQSKAEHAVADGKLVGSLAVLLAADDLIGLASLREEL